ncbi:MAG: hypothetical protein NC405_05020 [Odoribacter sp.]|nr:hypothetical protein [Odoribacter sp.]
MKYPSTKKIVNRLVSNYQQAARAISKAERRNDGEMSSWMTPESFEQTAESIESAYENGNFENVSDESQLQKLFDKFGAADIYHLAASYFNSTGKILNLQF